MDLNTKKVDPLKRAKIFFSQNAVRQNSWGRTLCYLIFDVLLLSGLAWHIWITQRDWHYWQNAPNPFNLFLLLQYFLIALCIRVPVTNICKEKTISKVLIMLSCLLLTNTILGTIWFFELTESKKESDQTTTVQLFNLKDEYLAHGIVLILIPWSIFCFLFIVLVKVICFFYADFKKQSGAGSRRRSNYGEFQDDEPLDQETEAIIGVYLKIMAKVKFSSSLNGTQNSESPNFMDNQKQCRLCLQYFKQEEKLLKIPVCDHIFHVHCLKNWLVAFQKCPVCDRNIILMPKQQLVSQDNPSMPAMSDLVNDKIERSISIKSPRSVGEQIVFSNQKNESEERKDDQI